MVGLKWILCLFTLISFVSCKKQEQGEYDDFSECNNLSEIDKIFVKNQSGIIAYTDKIGDKKLSGFFYILIAKDKKPIEICNMPSGLTLTPNESKNVLFSGNKYILATTTDMVTAKMELTELKFNN